MKQTYWNSTPQEESGGHRHLARTSPQCGQVKLGFPEVMIPETPGSLHVGRTNKRVIRLAYCYYIEKRILRALLERPEGQVFEKN
ncbi:MAG TPA: hypothetical protein PLG59_14210 [bacterium]|nr:hypothetical protein [bacterium]